MRECGESWITWFTFDSCATKRLQGSHGHYVISDGGSKLTFEGLPSPTPDRGKEGDLEGDHELCLEPSDPNQLYNWFRRKFSLWRLSEGSIEPPPEISKNGLGTTKEWIPLGFQVLKDPGGKELCDSKTSWQWFSAIAEEAQGSQDNGITWNRSLSWITGGFFSIHKVLRDLRRTEDG